MLCSLIYKQAMRNTYVSVSGGKKGQVPQILKYSVTKSLWMALNESPGLGTPYSLVIAQLIILTITQ